MRDIQQKESQALVEYGLYLLFFAFLLMAIVTIYSAQIMNNYALIMDQVAFK